MTPIEFDRAMERLGHSFPQANYSAERLKVIWEKCQWMPAHSFERIVGNFITGARYAPLPKDFIDASIKERQHLGEPRRESQPIPIVCQWCNDSGVNEIMRKSDGSEFFCRCDCMRSLERRHINLRPELPEWTEALAQEFLRHKFYGERALRWKPNIQLNQRNVANVIQATAKLWQKKLHASRVMWLAWLTEGGPEGGGREGA